MTFKEVYEKCKCLYLEAVYEDTTSNHKGTYEFELGSNVVLAILQLQYIDASYTTDELYLFGIHVRINEAEPFKIKLWREIR